MTEESSLSQNIGRFMCRVCGSLNVTFDSINGIVVCNICGHTESIRTYIPDLTSGSVVAGTVPPEPVVKTEEVFGYRRTTQEAFPHTHEEFKNIERDINELKKNVEQLQGVFPKVVVVEEVPKEEAKVIVEKYFKEHETADIEELMLNLRIPVQTIVEVIDELKREGKISAESEEKT